LDEISTQRAMRYARRAYPAQCRRSWECNRIPRKFLWEKYGRNLANLGEIWANLLLCVCLFL